MRSGSQDTDEERRVGSKSGPLGRLVFTYQGAHYYLARRTARLVPGIQSRSSGPRCGFRITTYEQALLDTLYKPYHCGGSSVVLEAWQEGTSSGRLDEEETSST